MNQPTKTRRMVCRCGCGQPFLVVRKPGRPREYVTKECQRKARQTRRAGRKNGNACGPRGYVYRPRRTA